MPIRNVSVFPSPQRRLLSGWLTLVIALAAAPAWAIDFPQHPQQWLNSPPLSFKNVAGKTVLLYFFHEDDPDCLARWTEMKALAKKYEAQPILFLGINSSGSREAVDGYLKQAKVDWPVLLDANRVFSRQCPITEVSADNGMQVAILNPDGTVIPGNWMEPEVSFQNSLKYGKWNVDYATIPAALKDAWRDVEYQQYTAASAAIRKALKAQKEDLKMGAETLMAYIQPLIDEKAAAAETAFDAGEKWPAYRTYLELGEQFKGYDLPANVAMRMKELQADSGVKTELAAMKTFDTARKQAINPAQKKKGITLLKKLIKDKPDTEAAQKAQALVSELET